MTAGNVQRHVTETAGFLGCVGGGLLQVGGARWLPHDLPLENSCLCQSEARGYVVKLRQVPRLRSTGPAVVSVKWRRENQ